MQGDSVLQRSVVEYLSSLPYGTPPEKQVLAPSSVAERTRSSLLAHMSQSQEQHPGAQIANFTVCS